MSEKRFEWTDYSTKYRYSIHDNEIVILLNKLATENKS